MTTQTQQRVYDLLGRMPAHGLAAAKQLFWTELNYDRANAPLSRRNWPDRAGDALDGDPIILAQHQSQFGSFDVVYGRLAAAYRGRDFPLSLTAERLAVNQLLNDHPYALFVFSDADERHWHLVNVRYDAAGAQGEGPARRRVFRRIAVGPYERLRTASERVAIGTPPRAFCLPVPVEVGEAGRRAAFVCVGGVVGYNRGAHHPRQHRCAHWPLEATSHCTE